MWFFSWSQGLLAVVTVLVQQQITLVSSASHIFKQRLADDVLISEYESTKPLFGNKQTAFVEVNNLIDNAPICRSLNAAFIAASDNQRTHSCSCLLSLANINGSSVEKLIAKPELWIRCTRSVMPYIYKQLNNVDVVNVSKLWIVDAHAVVIPSDMFAKIRPEVLTIERTRVAVIRDGAFKNFDKTLRKLILRDNLLANLNPEVFATLYRLEQLDIGKNKIAQLSAVILNPLKRLQVLRLDNNNLEQLADGTFEGLINLQILDISNNKLRHITNDTFRGLQNLEELHLQGNQLSDLHPNTFSHLTKLRVLNISNNGLSSLRLENIPNLEMLSINGNQISRMLKVELYGTPNLRQLFVNGNKISAIRTSDLQFLKPLKKLQSLILDNNIISTIEPSALHPAANIQTLSLQNNRLKHLSNGIRSCFEQLKSIKQLNLGSNRLDKINVYDLNMLNTLEVLQLNGNQIKKIDPRAFSNLKLKKLSLAANQLTGLPKGLFENINQSDVEFIDLTGNPWECEYTNQWLDSWLSQVNPSHIKDYKYLTCTARSSQDLVTVNSSESTISNPVLLHQTNSIFVSPFRISPFPIGYKPWILLCISGIPCVILLLILILLCRIACKKARSRRTVYDAYQIGCYNGISPNAFLLEGKPRLSSSTDPHRSSLLMTKPSHMSYPVAFKLLRYEKL